MDSRRDGWVDVWLETGERSRITKWYGKRQGVKAVRPVFRANQSSLQYAKLQKGKGAKIKCTDQTEKSKNAKGARRD
jgi:hypothetical protein